MAQCSHSYLPPKPKFEHRYYAVVCYVLTQLTHCAVWVCVHIGVLPNQTTQHLGNWGRSEMDSHVRNMRLGRVWWQQVHCNNLLITLKASSSDGFNVGKGGWDRLMNFESKAVGMKSQESLCVVMDGLREFTIMTYFATRSKIHRRAVMMWRKNLRSSMITTQSRNKLGL